MCISSGKKWDNNSLNRSIYYNIKLNIVLPGITSYFDPGFDVQASGEQLFNFVLTVSIGLFALSVIIPVRILIINNVDDYI